MAHSLFENDLNECERGWTDQPFENVDARPFIDLRFERLVGAGRRHPLGV